MCAKRLNVDCVPHCVRPLLLFLQVLSEMVAVDMIPYGVVKLTCKTLVVDGYGALLSMDVIAKRARFQGTTCAIPSRE